ncbi:MAG: carbohydrate-binding domain-containing protein [Clostridiales bacterium]|nr:carbohydrate-binding domain-containing protein [Clostridiales bacterium]
MSNKKTIMAIALCVALAAGVGGVAYFAGTKNASASRGSNPETQPDNTNTNAKASNSSTSNSGSGNSGNATVSDLALKITDKDKETTYDASKSNEINLDDTTGAVKISQEGTYIVTGSTADGMIVIDVGEEADVHLVLRDAKINSKNSAAIYVVSADEVYITLEGENTLSNGGTYKAIDENDIDAVIFSKDDLTINGSGTLNIDTQAEHAIVCKDDMVITGGTYNLTAKTDAINTNDSLAITSGTFNIECGDDAIHTDGILQIDGGTYEITAAEGLEGTYITINDGTFNINASDDGINAAQKVSDYKATLVVNGGDITIKMGAGDTDGIDSNGDIYINGGRIDITGQSTVDYDGTAEKNGGTLIINGTETDTIPNQFMGGGPGGRMGGGRGGNGDGNFPGGDGNFPGGDGNFPGGDGNFPGDGSFPSDWTMPSDGSFPGGDFPSDGSFPGFPGGGQDNGQGKGQGRGNGKPGQQNNGDNTNSSNL